MKAGFWQYIKAAFNARPMGMFVPPNWVGLAGAALLGLLNPGFWLIGAGAELTYLYLLSHNRRFQNWVDASARATVQQQSLQKLQAVLTDLPGEDQQRYRTLEQRCQTILAQQKAAEGLLDLNVQGEGLGKLTWIYLRLLRTRTMLMRSLRESASVDLEPLDRRRQRLDKQLQQTEMAEDLRRSLTGQREIVEQRMAKQREAREKLAFLEAELTRIEDQVELIREQAGLLSDPNALSQRIDQVAATLGGTSQWIKDQQKTFGQVEELLAEPPPLPMVAEEQ